MNNSSMLLRSLVIYAIILPLAIFLGCLVAGPLTWTSFGTVLAVFAILVLPVMLRFHHPVLVLGWNAAVIVFFLPGAPRIWLPLALISLTISVVRRAMDQRFRFVSVPSVTWPLIFLAVVVLITAQATGGIGLKSLGGNVYGGKRYFFLLGAIVGYFALTAHRIPLKRANFFMGLYLLGGTTAVIGDMFYYVSNGSLQFLYLFFPLNMNMEGVQGFRFGGIATISSVIVFYLLARHGIRGIFSITRPWRLVLFALFSMTSLLGGFRTILITIMLVFALQFYLEGLYRTRLLPLLFLAGVLGCAVMLPFVKQLPFSVQRALSVLPIDVDPVARMDAEGTAEWRLQIWKAVLPQVPRYLLLGKGLGMTPQDFDYSLSNYTGTIAELSEDDNWAAVSGDYHSGPLSVIIPFGIWGVIALFWFLWAAFRLLYRNFRYGDPALRIINTFLLASFAVKIFIFFVIFGGFYGDIQSFVGHIAMSICLNGGMARPVVEPEPETAKVAPLAAMLPRPRPVMGRMGPA
jgi:O-Antigen ligase